MAVLDERKLNAINPDLPPEVDQFEAESLQSAEARIPIKAAAAALQRTELRDVTQQIVMRWLLAGFFGILLLLQHLGLFFIIKWALEASILTSLQPVFAILVPATLAQTYGIARLIVDRMFKPIDYGDKQSRF